MPRKTRRQLVGKDEDSEQHERERRLETLRWELRRLGRLRPEPDIWPGEGARSA